METNQTRNHEVTGSIPGGLDPTLLWLWHRLVAVALIGPLAWEPPYAMGVALEKGKKTKKKTKQQKQKLQKKKIDRLDPIKK